MKVLKRIGLITLISFLVILSIVLGYLAYVFISYDRIEDNLSITPTAPKNGTSVYKADFQTGETYTILTNNIGFGAYSPEFTFFMDGGTESWAFSEEAVYDNLSKAVSTLKSNNPDLILLQEIDVNSTRSYHINELEYLQNEFADYSSTAASNYHSAFLMYPITQPHGSSNSVLATFSTREATSCLRRSLPISTSLSKLLDLDRCYSITRYNVDGGKELVVFNVHLSAYGGSDEIHSAQITMLVEDMQKEYELGNYVICGGDFNHDLTGTSVPELNGEDCERAGWAQPFPNEYLTDDMTLCTNYTSGTTQPTCRDCDIPWEEGNFSIIVDGFIVSNNVTVTYLENIQTGFEYSDHNPVKMTFTLNP